MTALPDNNPKTVYGARKPPFHFIPPVAEMVLGQAMQNGGEKYGAMNWREKTVSSSIYYDAARRHLSAWLDGEDIAPDSGVHHLGHVMACCAIIVDAAASGRLNDDRPVKGAFSKECERLTKVPPEAADDAARAAVEGEDKELLADLIRVKDVKTGPMPFDGRKYFLGGPMLYPPGTYEPNTAGGAIGVTYGEPIGGGVTDQTLYEWDNATLGRLAGHVVAARRTRLYVGRTVKFRIPGSNSELKGEGEIVDKHGVYWIVKSKEGSRFYCLENELTPAKPRPLQ